LRIIQEQADAAAAADPDASLAKRRGQRFVESIMVDYESIPNSTDMFVLRNVVDLETEERRDFVIRNITELFWKACIDVVDTPNERYRVCAVGTPGIGKTTATAILIRMLLKAGHTVVYTIRTKNDSEWFYEFKPTANAGVTSVKVYPQTLPEFKIPSLRERSTYYVVDPGQTKDDCNPNGMFQAKVILVVSPDDRHWGESEFAKIRGLVQGFFRFFPVWFLEELLSARPILGPTLSEEQIRERYRQVGGVPRHVFARTQKAFEAVLSKQEMALNGLSAEQTKLLAVGKIDATNA
jgi:hypothetical protein